MFQGAHKRLLLFRLQLRERDTTELRAGAFRSSEDRLQYLQSGARLQEQHEGVHAAISNFQQRENRAGATTQRQ